MEIMKRRRFDLDTSDFVKLTNGIIEYQVDGPCILIVALVHEIPQNNEDGIPRRVFKEPVVPDYEEQWYRILFLDEEIDVPDTEWTWETYKDSVSNVKVIPRGSSADLFDAMVALKFIPLVYDTEW